MIPRYFMILWKITFYAECLPEEYRQWIFKYLLDAATECQQDSDPSSARQSAGLLYLCEEVMAGQIVKYTNDDGNKEERAYSVYSFEKRNVVYGIAVRTLAEDVPFTIL